MSDTTPAEGAEPVLGVDKDAPRRSRSRKASESQPGDSISAATGAPTSFWLATEKDLDRHLDEQTSEPAPTEKDTTDGNENADKAESSTGKDLHEALTQVFPKLDVQGNVSGFRNLPTLVPSTHYQNLAHHSNTVSQPLTPLHGTSPMGMDWGSALPSTPKSGSLHSLQLSDVDSPIDVEDTLEDHIRSSLIDSEPPQLVMPSLSMPDRRPITDKGRLMGNLRMCVAGGKGSGKTSLIRAIVQQCEDIVHIDTQSTPTSPPASIKTLSKPSPKDEVPGIIEIMASTKCYPPWWNDMEDSRILRRRKSGGDSILERNLCFVDTPGFNTIDDHSMADIFKYIEHTFLHIDTPADFSDLERLNLVTGKGGSLVDVVLFIFSDASNFENEFQVFLQLCSLTNTIPLIGKSDLLDKIQVLSRKMDILTRLQTSGRPFLFGKSTAELLEITSKALTEPAPTESEESTSNADNPSQDAESRVKTTQEQTPMSSLFLSAPEYEIHPPFAVSSLPGSDSSEMDASLLMSDSYSPPLRASDLSELINRLFDPENMAWLKHSAGRKYLAWRKGRIDKKRSGPLIPHDGRRSGRRQHDHDQELSFTSRFRGYATTSMNNMMKEASLGSGDERTRRLLERLCSEVKRGAIGTLDSSGQTLGDSERRGTLCLPSSESSTVVQSTTADASALTPRHPFRTHLRSRHSTGTRELELPKWSRPKQSRHVRHAAKQDEIIKGELKRRRDLRREQQQRLNDMHAVDPLGIVAAWEDWGKALMWGAGGGVLVGVVVVLGRWWMARTSTD